MIEHCTCKNNHVHREPFSDIERKKEVAKMQGFPQDYKKRGQ